MTVFAIVIVNGLSKEVDQIVETKAIAQKERKDLLKMGFEPSEVKIKEFPNWEAAEAYETKLRGW